MSTGFDLACAFTLAADIEGGRYDGKGSHDPNPTNIGITFRTLIDAHYDVDQDGDIDLDDLWALTPEKAKKIYEPRYWLAAHCHELPLPVAIAHFDTAVNCGPGRALKILHDALDIKRSNPGYGRFGPLTRSLVDNAVPFYLLDRQTIARLEFYNTLVRERPAKKPALGHWLYRTLKCNRHARDVV